MSENRTNPRNHHNASSHKPSGKGWQSRQEQEGGEKEWTEKAKQRTDQRQHHESRQSRSR